MNDICKSRHPCEGPLPMNVCHKWVLCLYKLIRECTRIVQSTCNSAGLINHANFIHACNEFS